MIDEYWANVSLLEDVFIDMFVGVNNEILRVEFVPIGFSDEGLSGIAEQRSSNPSLLQMQNLKGVIDHLLLLFSMSNG